MSASYLHCAGLVLPFLMPVRQCGHAEPRTHIPAPTNPHPPPSHPSVLWLAGADKPLKPGEDAGKQNERALGRAGLAGLGGGVGRAADQPHFHSVVAFFTDSTCTLSACRRAA